MERGRGGELVGSGEQDFKGGRGGRRIDEAGRGGEDERDGWKESK